MRSGKRSHGEGTIRPRGNKWRFEYQRQSKTVKAADYPTKKELNKAFADWRAELDEQAKAPPIITMSHLFDKFLAQHRRNGRAETPIVEKKIERYLRPRLGAFDAMTFGLKHVDDYIEKRQQEKTPKGTLVRNGTINRELAIIRTSLRLLRPEPRILLIKDLDEEDGIRQGLVSEDDYRLFLRELNDYQKPVWCFSYYTGVRQGELLKLRREWARDWEQTKLIEVPGWFHKERITKNGKPHHIPIYTEGMCEMLRWALETADPACPYLFQRAGKRINKQTFYEAMKRTAVRLGRPDILFHDLRRTAITNMIEAGIPPDEARDVSGHLDPSVFKRYNIISSAKAKASVVRTGERMERWHQEKIATDYARITPSETEENSGKMKFAAKPN